MNSFFTQWWWSSEINENLTNEKQDVEAEKNVHETVDKMAQDTYNLKLSTIGKVG